MPDHASDLLKDGESAIVIFTRGSKFKFDKAGKGYSGNWLIKPNQEFDKVIIYYRPKEYANGAELYIGEFKKIVDALLPDTQVESATRRAITFSNLKRVGKTTINFRQFSGTRRNAFCFINGINQ